MQVVALVSDLRVVKECVHNLKNEEIIYVLGLPLYSAFDYRTARAAVYKLPTCHKMGNLR
jgi:hypothetical protein